MGLKMIKGKTRAFAACTGLLLIPISSGLAQARASSDVIENITSVIASQSLCSFNVNQDMLLAVMGNAGVTPADLQAGGLYGKEVASSKARIARLSSTEEGKRSLCRTIKSNLSAMFD